MKKRIRILLAALAIMLLPCQMVSAASVTFTNFSYTTVPYTEYLQSVAAKTKADNEQKWYATITGSTGLSSTTARVLLTSSTTNNSMQLRSALVPIYSTTTSFNEPYFIKTNKGTACRLYITGNGNSGATYAVKISGRYTS